MLKKKRRLDDEKKRLEDEMNQFNKKRATIQSQNSQLATQTLGKSKKK